MHHTGKTIKAFLSELTKNKIFILGKENFYHGNSDNPEYE